MALTPPQLVGSKKSAATFTCSTNAADPNGAPPGARVSYKSKFSSPPNSLFALAAKSCDVTDRFCCARNVGHLFPIGPIRRVLWRNAIRLLKRVTPAFRNEPSHLPAKHHIRIFQNHAICIIPVFLKNSSRVGGSRNKTMRLIRCSVGWVPNSQMRRD